MRLLPEQIIFIKNYLHNIKPNAQIYLFGSRVDDSAKGGDIDILLLTDELMEKKKIRKFRVDFYKRFDWQKIDILNFSFSDKNPFKKIALDNAVKI